MRRYILFLMLFMSCGQTLALPLLSSCESMGQIPENELTENHHHSAMQMNHDTHDMLSINFSESSESNCNHDCNFCVLSSIALIESTYFNQPSIIKSILPLNNLPLFSTTTASLFRPPITA